MPCSVLCASTMLPFAQTSFYWKVVPTYTMLPMSIVLVPHLKNIKNQSSLKTSNSKIKKSKKKKQTLNLKP